MTTDTFTLPDSATAERFAPAPRTLPAAPTTTEQPVSARLPRLRRGGWSLVRQLLSDDPQQSARDHLLVLGPSGGPLGAFRQG